jgi:hypothetical protein
VIDRRVSDLSVTDRASPDVRCAICHGPFDAEAAALACPLCKTPCHEECRKSLGRCPVIGCGVKPPRPPGPWHRVPILLSAATGLGLAVALAGLDLAREERAALVVAHLVLVPGFWVQVFSRARGFHRFGRFVFGAVGVGFGEVVLGGLGYSIFAAVPDEEIKTAAALAGILGSVGWVLLPPYLAALMGVVHHERRRPI